MLRHPGGAIRIIGGQWKRTPLSVIDVPGLRPTPDRVRETVFNWLTHLFGGSLAGCSALDLFAGTGAMGLEAASRGASPVVLVERDHAALAALRAIATRLNATQVDVLGDDAVSIVRKYVAAGTRFSIIFLDPPFGQGWLPKVLPLTSELCNSTGVIYAESETTLEASLLAACKLELVRADKAGDVFYHLLRRNNNE
ncbi:MAG: 16S rRNA (guanine(966)-N(2))-methyltransferase RsmD [Burkholderiaceae bacterium]